MSHTRSRRQARYYYPQRQAACLAGDQAEGREIDFDSEAWEKVSEQHKAYNRARIGQLARAGVEAAQTLAIDKPVRPIDQDIRDRGARFMHLAEQGTREALTPDSPEAPNIETAPGVSEQLVDRLTKSA